ncbi:MAG TPA: hypothetical protein VF482_15985 [Trebonia sp.]
MICAVGDPGAAHADKPRPGRLWQVAAALQTQMYDHALTTGFSRGYLVSASILVLMMIIALTVVRIRRQDVSGADPMPVVRPGRRRRRVWR